MALASLRPRLSDAEPESEDRSTTTPEAKRSRAHCTQQDIRDIVVWLQGMSWCEEVVLEQSSSCCNICKNGTFSELSANFMKLWSPDANGGWNLAVSCHQKVGISSPRPAELLMH